MKKRITISAGAILLAGALAAGVCCMGFVSRNDDGKWFQNGNISTWHWSNKAGDDKSNIPDDNKPVDGEETGKKFAPLDSKGNEMGGDQVYSMPKGVTFRSAAALNSAGLEYDSVKVKAVVSPANADIVTLEYSAAWANPESAWATNKKLSDYFVVSQSEANDMEAELQCLQPFGEQILVTVTAVSVGGKSATDSCTVDFMKRFKSASFNFVEADSWDGYEGHMRYYCDTRSEFVQLNGTNLTKSFAFSAIKTFYTDYTVDDTIGCSVFLVGSDDGLTALSSLARFNVRVKRFDITTGNYSFFENGFYNLSSPTEIISGAQLAALQNAWKSMLSTPVFEFEFYINGRNSTSYRVPLNTSSSTISISVSDVTLDNSGIVI